MTKSHPRIRFVTCASHAQVLGQNLLASQCLASGGHEIAIHWGAASAAAAFNAEMQQPITASWLVWAHQDVFLPPGWAEEFIQALGQAEAVFPLLAVAGVYGVSGTGEELQRAGCVNDRGSLLRESAALPCRVDSLDELLFAVRVDSGLALDPRLGFDFYATDLVLQARRQGLDAVVVDAYCEHWSSTPLGRIDNALKERIDLSGAYFEQKWQSALPLSTPCLSIQRPGDVARWTSRLQAVPHD